MQLTIKGYTFNLTAPYSEGHKLTAGEAQALNDLRRENIGNNFRPQVAEQVARIGTGDLLSQSALDGLQASLTAYDQSYRFAEKSGRSRLGDLDIEARVVATERARQQGHSLSSEQINALVEEFVKLPAVLEEARTRVAARRSALAGGMESL